MAGLRGGQAYIARAKQTAKGTPNTTYAEREPFSGGNIAPSREIDNLSETDANRDQGISYVQQTGVEGSPERYVRDTTIHHHLYDALGAIATTGTTDFEHVITPANSLPYLTLLKGLGGTLWEQFNDCKVGELTISSDTGGALTVSSDVQGREAVRLTSEPGSLPALEAIEPFYMNEAAVTLGGASTSLVGSFELTISNNLSLQQTDDSKPYDVVEGQREVTLGFNLIFETLAEYNKFHYGGAAGTAQSSSLATTSFEITFSKSATNFLTLELPLIAYEEFPVEPDPGGDPVEVDVRARAQRGAAVVTATVGNQESA